MASGSVLSLPEYFSTQDAFTIYPKRQSNTETQEKSDLIVRYNKDNHTVSEIDPTRTLMVSPDKNQDCAHGR